MVKTNLMIVWKLFSYPISNLTIVMLLFCSFSPLSRPPSIVWIFVDNVGYGDLGCYGNKEVITPRIDQLAAEGVLCTDFYIGSPTCMPSRGALLTGRHPLRNGLNEQIYKIDELQQIALLQDEKIVPAYLKEAGYVSGCFGKWNLGFAPGSRPLDRGFDEYFGFISGNADYYTHIYNGRNDLYRNNEPAQAEGYSTDLFADAACAFIKQNKDSLFFCYVPFNAAHFPNPRNKPPGVPSIWQAPDEAFARYGMPPDTLNEAVRYKAVLTALDDGVGKILDQLDRLNLKESTLVVFLSDNGAFLMTGRGLECASNRPFRAGGTTVWEGGIRVPCILRWPGTLPAGKVNSESMISMDLLPMALQAASLPLPDDRILDGFDITDCLQGKAKLPHQYLYWEYGGRAIRHGNFKLIQESGANPDWQLFNLEKDPGETYNLAARYPEMVTQLQKQWERWRQNIEE